MDITVWLFNGWEWKARSLFVVTVVVVTVLFLWLLGSGSLAAWAVFIGYLTAAATVSLWLTSFMVEQEIFRKGWLSSLLGLISLLLLLMAVITVGKMLSGTALMSKLPWWVNMFADLSGGATALVCYVWRLVHPSQEE